jgi:pyrimidine operon attenuation protein/uracil phosphoribosyltransferase
VNIQINLYAKKNAMIKDATLIVDGLTIKHSTRRIAYQIYEANFNHKAIYMIGVAKSGVLFAKSIITVLKEISDLDIHFIQLEINKKDPHLPIKTSEDLSVLKNQSVVLVDDVLNTGSTLIYAVKHLLEVPIKQLKTAVLVNRNHKNYPIKADFKGISLSTSINEHIEVNLNPKSEGVYLN